MAKKATYASTKRFGPRYGKKLRERYGSIETEQKKKHKCPYCSYTKVKKVSVGIWKCENCSVKFAGKAYTIGKPTNIRLEVEE